MENFDGIVEFVAVAESQGFSAAAKQLGCSTSHVSRQVSRLEERLGSSLLARSTRQVSLTQAGTAYYQRCKELVIGLQQANEQVSQQQFQLNGTLRVSGAGIFAEQYVAPALIEFGLKHPGLKINMDFNSKMVNFVEDGIDFAIRYGRLEDSGLVARKLADRQMMAVASPSYLKENGIPNHPDQLKTQSCLVANNDEWVFDLNGEPVSVKVSGRWRTNNAHAIVKACEQGLGIAYMPKSSFSGSIQQGLLEPILESFCGRGASSWIVYQNRRFLPMRARMAIDYLADYFSDWVE
ncbi:LysR family transcriptional regulator [Microbulbifer sp. ZKSA004]|uniref:LysR family transcriptional regulator n=1 Tax=Microbulbifer sp. ZKSA004 TaxID=3243389 RepID=UPI0040390590